MKGSTIIPFVTDIDYNIGKWLNGMLHSTNGRFTPILKFITSLGNVGIAFIITALIMLLFLRTRKVGMLLLVSMLLWIILTNVILKNVIARPRPYLNQLSDFYIWWNEAGALLETGYSFPSGHTTAAMAFGFTLFLCFKKSISWLFLLIPLIMGFTRIYFMVHYASDIIGALLVGAVCSLLSFVIFKYTKNWKVVNRLLELPSILKLFSR